MRHITRRSLIAALVVAFSAVALVLTGCGPQPLEGSSWKLTDWAAERPLPSRYEVTLDIEDGELTGNAPINSYGGDLRVSRDGTFEVGDIHQTLIGGPEPMMEDEATYFELLRSATAYQLDGARLTLRDETGIAVLVFSAR